MAVLLIGTLDTKGEELGFVRDLLRVRYGRPSIVVDVGSLGPPRIRPDISCHAVLRHAGTTMEAVAESGDRGEAVAALARGVASVARKIRDEGKLDGALGLGGSAGTVIGSAALRALPFGLPKVLVSTLASGQTRPFLHGSDIVLVPTVADLPGLNRLTRTVLGNATHALIGMILADGRPILGGGAGTGLSAKLAEAGGIDLIIIYNSGRFRMAGRGSLAGRCPTATPTPSSWTWPARSCPWSSGPPSSPASAGPTRPGT